MSSPKLLAYKAIIEMAQALTSIVNDPSILKSAYEENVKGQALSESAIAERDAAIATIEKAKNDSISLEQEKADFKNEVDQTLKSLKDQKSKIEIEQRVADDKLSEAKDLIAKSALEKANATTLLNQANAKFSDIDNKDVALKKTLNDIALASLDLESKNIALKDREDAVYARELAIAEFSGKIARK